MILAWASFRKRVRSISSTIVFIFRVSAGDSHLHAPKPVFLKSVPAARLTTWRDPVDARSTSTADILGYSNNGRMYRANMSAFLAFPFALNVGELTGDKAPGVINRYDWQMIRETRIADCR